MPEQRIGHIQSIADSEWRLGFLTAVELQERGHVAGLLVTNRYSRPLEFQCTTPVKANHTQELLYGPTLEPYILGELLGRPLLEKVSVKPHLVITDRAEMLELRNHISIPVVCLAAPHESARLSDSKRTTSLAPDLSASGSASDSANTSTAKPVLGNTESKYRLGRQFLRFHSAHQADRDLLAAFAETVPDDADLAEPLDRVREALKEAVGSPAGASR